MHATALRHVFLPLLCLLLGSVLPLAASTVPRVPTSDSLPSAPEPSVVSAPSTSDLHPAVIHNSHVTIDRVLSIRDGNGQCDTKEPILPPTYSSMMNDGKTLYLKVSYLLRF